MNAGSSPDTGKSGIKGFVIPITEPPVVEIDTEATAAYIRLRDTKVVATKPFGSEKGLVMLDFDADENVVGIEVGGAHPVISPAFAEASRAPHPSEALRRAGFEAAHTPQIVTGGTHRIVRSDRWADRRCAGRRVG